MIGNTLTTTITQGGAVLGKITTTRNTGESDNDFIDRHCRAVLAWLNAHPIAGNMLSCEDPAVDYARQSGQSNDDFVAAYDDLLKWAA